MKRKENDLQITINDFRAIKEANIALNGITVLAGINGSGKSTVSKLVYLILHEMNNYNEIIFHRLNSSIRKYIDVLENILLTSVSNYDLYKSYTKLLQVSSIDDLQNIQENVGSVCKVILAITGEGNKHFSERSINRYRKMMINTINESDSISFEDALARIEEHINKEVTNAKEFVRRRPFALLSDYLERSFGEKVSKRVSISEYGDSIFSEDRRTAPIPHFVNKLYYIDTPFALENYYYSYWKDLNDALKVASEQYSSSVASFIEERVIKGHASYENTDSYSGFFFQDKRGRKISLSVAATGIRSFSIIQMLLRSGEINDDTLLILDEPESHLHPQWIIEYARMVILLHKTVGTKFLISTHNPDMVSAIRYIADAENCTNNLEFYTARQANDGTGRFSFKSTGLEIDPIFKSFNKSYEKLNHYSKGYEQEE